MFCCFRAKEPKSSSDTPSKEQSTTHAASSVEKKPKNSEDVEQRIKQEEEEDCVASPSTHLELNRRLEISLSDLTFSELIGKGAFKSVYRGRWCGTMVAIMCLRKGGMLVEARVLQRISAHPNLVQFYRWARDGKGNEYMVVEWLKMGALDTFLINHGSTLETKQKICIIEQVASAMMELAMEGVWHRDLATRNILVSSLNPINVKVSDFGLARHAVDAGPAGSSSTSNHKSSQEILQSIPIRWSPPEVLTQYQWSEKSDVWSFGVLVWEVFSCGLEPFQDKSNEQVYHSVTSRDQISPLPRPNKCPTEVYKLMLRCWEQKPENRPSFVEIIATFKSWRQAYVLEKGQSGGSSSQLSLPGLSSCKLQHQQSANRSQHVVLMNINQSGDLDGMLGLGLGLRSEVGSSKGKGERSKCSNLSTNSNILRVTQQVQQGYEGAPSSRSSIRELSADVPSTSKVANASQVSQETSMRYPRLELLDRLVSEQDEEMEESTGLSFDAEETIEPKLSCSLASGSHSGNRADADGVDSLATMSFTSKGVFDVTRRPISSMLELPPAGQSERAQMLPRMTSGAKTIEANYLKPAKNPLLDALSLTFPEGSFGRDNYNSSSYKRRSYSLVIYLDVQSPLLRGERRPNQGGQRPDRHYDKSWTFSTLPAFPLQIENCGGRKSTMITLGKEDKVPKNEKQSQPYHTYVDISDFLKI